ncbi:MAG: DUF362 domain-containing protein [Dehalococcoidales bacterium]|nr:DUF362 domain-containing protein [Dehalococcoidales bacterium]
MTAKIALTAGNDRYRNIGNALNLIEDEIDLTGKSDIVIKVNFVNTRIQVASTHVEGVKALLDFLRKRYDGKITIAEFSLQVPARDAYENFGYMDLLKDYDVDMVDLADDDSEIFHLYDSRLQQMDIHYSKRMLNNDYLISIGPPKTHDIVIVTHSIKNIVMGGPVKYADKVRIHQGPVAANLDLYLMATRNLPDLAVIDGFTAMEGDGPIFGEAVDWRIAVAGCDPVAADCFTTDLMGFSPEEIGYLYYLARKGYGNGSIEDMEIFGENPDDHRRQFKPHPGYRRQKQWADERVNKIIGL